MIDFGDVPRGRNDTKRLVQCVRSTRSALSKVVASGSDVQGHPLFHKELVPAMRTGWKEIDAHFTELENAVPKLSTTQLRAHGFTGRLLDFKLKVTAWSWRRFEEFGGTRLLRRFLEAADNVLESLIDATGVGRSDQRGETRHHGVDRR